MLLLLVTRVVCREQRRLNRVRDGLIWFAVAQSLLAVLQSLQGNVLLFEEFYRSYYWFTVHSFPRFMGTTDHPLTLSLLATVAIPLLAGWRRTGPSIVCAIALLAGIAVTQSRTGLVLGFAGALYVLARGNFSRAARFVSFGALIPLGLLVASSEFVGRATLRFSDDSGSSTARAYARDFFLAHYSDYIFFGEGIGASYNVAAAAGLGTSLESSVLMYAVDIGLAGALVYVGVLCGLVATARRGQWAKGVLVAGVLAVVVPQTFSALATQSAAAVIVWTAIALASASDIVGNDGEERIPGLGQRPCGATFDRTDGLTGRSTGLAP
jgi:hypothetical protein